MTILLVTSLTLSSDFPVTPAAFQPSCGTDGKCNQVCDPDLKTCRSTPTHSSPS